MGDTRDRSESFIRILYKAKVMEREGKEIDINARSEAIEGFIKYINNMGKDM